MNSCFPTEGIHMGSKHMKMLDVISCQENVNQTTTSEIPLHILEMDLIMEKTVLVECNKC